MSSQENRLDAPESMFFARQNEFIDKTIYETVYPDLQARSFIPAIAGVPDSVPVYTWRRYSRVGSAAIVDGAAGDLPRSDAVGEEASQVIKTLGTSYGWTILEIKEAARTGTPLEMEKANSARYQLESTVDQILATGGLVDGSTYWARGLLNLLNTTSFSPVTKSKGGTAWANGTPDEIAADVNGLCGAIVSALKGAGGQMFQRFDVVMPVDKYTLISQKRMGDGSDVTVLNYLKGNSPYINSITPWFRCTAASGGGSTDRIVAYPKQGQVLGSLVPMEYQTLTPEQRGLNQVIPALMRTGGVIARIPVAVGYLDIPT
jgi:hypothetical protein